MYSNFVTESKSTFTSTMIITATLVYIIAFALSSTSASPARQWIFQEKPSDLFDASTAVSSVRTFEPGTDRPCGDGHIGGVKICTDTDYEGTCAYAVVPLDTCIQLESPWFHAISSFSPDRQTFCTLSKDRKCEDGLLAPGAGIAYPGDPDLRYFDINDQIGSFECHLSGWGS